MRELPARERNVITYVPRYQADNINAEASSGGGGSSRGEMNRLQRAAYFYTDRIGLRHVAVLYLSLIYQGVIAFLTGVHAMRHVPLLSALPKEGPGGWVAIIIYLLCGYLFQLLLIFELAQVVWLRRPDRLRVRLESQSYWWLVWLGLLILSLGFDLFLVALSLTGATNFSEAFTRAWESNLTVVLDGLMMLMNFLTLLRCSMVMRTSTVEQNRQEIEEQLETIASEMMLEAGESTQEAAREVWRSLNINPTKFIPLQDSVLGLIAKQFPQFFPEGLGGDTWGYDFSSHSMVVLPPDLHQAFSAARGKTDRIKEPDLRQLLQLSPPDLAELIEYNIQTYGKPRFVDASVPDEPPTFIYDAANLDVITRRDKPVANVGGANSNATISSPASKGRISGGRAASSSQSENGSSNSGEASQTTSAVTPAAQQIPLMLAGSGGEFISQLSPMEQALFAAYLTNTVFPQVHGTTFPQLPHLNIYQMFDEVELQWYYRYWHKHRPQQNTQPA